MYRERDQLLDQQAQEKAQFNIYENSPYPGVPLWAHLLSQQVNQEFKESKPSWAHSISGHGPLVAKYTDFLASAYLFRRKEREKAVCSGLLHDVGYATTETEDIEGLSHQMHPLFSSLSASRNLERWLEQIGYPDLFSPKDIKEIRQNIFSHPDPILLPGQLISLRLVRDADRIVGLGALGILRAAHSYLSSWREVEVALLPADPHISELLLVKAGEDSLENKQLVENHLLSFLQDHPQEKRTMTTVCRYRLSWFEGRYHLIGSDPDYGRWALVEEPATIFTQLFFGEKYEYLQNFLEQLWS